MGAGRTAITDPDHAGGVIRQSLVRDHQRRGTRETRNTDPVEWRSFAGSRFRMTAASIAGSLEAVA
jgi:hypothetical protein